MGVKPEQIELFGEALFDLLEQVLGPYGAWDDATRDAWKWIWGIVQAVFVKHMETSAMMLDNLQKSWETIQERKVEEIIGRKFYERLFATAPELQPMFKKPFKMQVVMLVRALDLVVRSVQDTNVITTELKALAMTHIKYNINQSHLNVFGEVLVQTLKEVMGPHHWNGEIEAAWAAVYMHISEVFGQVLSSGRNLISKALADGSAGDLKRALQSMPRGKRALGALEIDVEDTAISPIVWSIQDGLLAMTEVLIKDLLIIRGDRESYYCGRSLLWQKHPNLMRLLIDKAPSLISTLLDGHIWSSRFMQNGRRRVNFYVAELYGDPSMPENRNVYNTALGVLITKLPDSDVSVFGHPCITFLVELKWRLFARRRFMLSQMLNVANLALSTAYLQFGAAGYSVTSFVLGVMQLLAGTLRLLSYAMTIANEVKLAIGETKRIFGYSFRVPYLLHDVFYWVNVLSACMCVLLFTMTWTVDPFQWKENLLSKHYIKEEHHDSKDLKLWGSIAAFTSGLLWLEIAEVFQASTKLSALLYAFLSVMADVMRFLIVLAVWTIGFSMTLYWLMVASNLSAGLSLSDAVSLDLETVDGADALMLIYFVIMSCLGLTGSEAFIASSWVVRVVFAVCVLTTVIVLLNLLVSTMVNTYDILQRSCDELAVRSRAVLVVRAEAQLSMRHRQKIYQSLKLDEPLDFEHLDKGPSGGLQEMMPSKDMKHPAFEQSLKQLERYTGTAAADLPWDETTMEVVACGADVETSQQPRSIATGDDPNKMLADIWAEILALRSEMKNADGKSQSSAGSHSTSRPDGSNCGHGSCRVEHEPIQSEGVIPAIPGADKGFCEDADHHMAVPTRIVTYSELAKHGTEESLWLLVDGLVRDCTSLLSYHPGGKEVLLTVAGQDASGVFHAAHKGPSLTPALSNLHSLPVIGLIQDSNSGDI
mmetsp:Transcript_14931/g.35579  ORF Transcript_14931/g.35579 Transcript_14931/m.35579 type:complete len:934 (-) Transcript_14931:434-3235(-)